MPKKQNKNNNAFLNWVRRTPVMFAISVIVVTATLTGGYKVLAVTCSSAADCQQQIANTSNQLNSSKQTLGQLGSQAASYQDTISQLQGQISGLQSQITANEATQASLQTQITQGQAELAQQKSVLATDLQALYVSGQITPIEMLATSSSISQYVDQQAAYTAVQDKIQSTVQQISSLESKLQSEKIQVDNLIGTQQTQQSQLASDESQQSSLLSLNQQQQTQYNQQIAADSSDISQLNARLSALNDAGSSTIISSGTCGGGYPAKAVNPYYPGDGFSQYWGCDYGQDTSEDNWHMENRECVSYTAYMVQTNYGVSTNDWGNAYQWITAAESHGFLVDQTPAPGAIAIRGRDYSEAGDVGHAMYVESVNGPDSITVNEYNEHYNGTFDERTFAPSSYDSRGGIYYIHFN